MSFKVKDHYFKKAKKNNYVARSVFKLEEIDKKFRILKKNMHILDLGYHPGSWIQYTSPIIGSNGHIYGIDLKPPNEKLNQSFKNITLLQMDISHIEPFWNKPLDAILSDMAPDTSGIKSVDQQNSLNLIEQVFDAAPPTPLAPEGHPGPQSLRFPSRTNLPQKAKIPLQTILPLQTPIHPPFLKGIFCHWQGLPESLRLFLSITECFFIHTDFTKKFPFAIVF